MAQTDALTRIEQVLDNDYAQEQLQEGIRNLRAAYQRASKRRVQPAKDDRVRRQVQSAVTSLGEAAKAIRTGRDKPKPRWGRRIAVVIAIGAAGTAAAVAAKSAGADEPNTGG